MDLQRKLDFIENYRTALELLKHKEMRMLLSVLEDFSTREVMEEIFFPYAGSVLRLAGMGALPFSLRSTISKAAAYLRAEK